MATMASFGSGLVAGYRALTSRVTTWLLERIPVSFFVRSALRWLAFSATAHQLQIVIGFCAGALPIAESAVQAAELRELYTQACTEELCSPELQEQVNATTAFVEDATENALAALIASLDANADGKVSLAELRDAWVCARQPEGESIARAAPSTPTATAASVLEAMRRTKQTVAELERLRYSVTLAVEGAVAAVDEDGDGTITLEEAVGAPQRIASWLEVWRELLERGKL